MFLALLLRASVAMKYIKRFSEIGIDDVALVGGKNASLGEMFRALSAKNVRVPGGYAITADAYRHFLESNRLTQCIDELIADLDIERLEDLANAGYTIREWIVHGAMPEDLAGEIMQAYRELSEVYGPHPDVAVRSSATAEDLPSASFAGQQETYLNIRGEQTLLATCKQVFASLFTNRAIAYRVHHGFEHTGIALSIGVQKMVRSDLAASGVMFTLDTESGFRDVVFITAAYGLGENIVQGKVNPDEFYVFKPTLATGHRPILMRQLGSKELKMIYSTATVAGMSTRDVRVRKEDREQFSIDDEDVLTLARYAVAIEEHYSAKAGRPVPMDIEWAKDGQSGELFVVQARPETVQSQRDTAIQQIYAMRERGRVLVRGKSVGQRIASGRTRLILEAAQMNDLQQDEILVTDMTDPDWEPVMKRAAAIVTNRGGRTCHAAIVARELGIPAVIGCGNATQMLDSGQDVTVSCAEGDTGYVYKGLLDFAVEEVDLNEFPVPATKLMINVGNPGQAFETSKLPAQGVGLARLEFIINNSIQVHPRALLDYDQLDEATRARIDEATAGYGDRTRFYVERLAEGVGTIGAAFYPRTVIVRLSDFKSNEYASLIGGEHFEPQEENPMIGFRGASRYYSKDFAQSFVLECQAMKKVREDMGLDNVAVMLPFVRTVEEGNAVLDLMADQGLKRGENGLQVFLMCEIPSNALLADQFLDHFDGMSIGSNDLTQLTLGVDRDSGMLSGYDERNPAVLALMEMAIKACRARDKYIGICGQAPSDFPEITRWLVERGISSISLNPDSLLTMIPIVLETEAKAKSKPGQMA
jgi:pyruvate,water dikinase